MLTTSFPETTSRQDIFHRQKKQGTSTMLRLNGQQGETVRQFADSVATGLNHNPRSLDCRFLYDAPGSALYEEICRQPEYYPTRTEAAILTEHARDIRAATGPVLFFELGAGCACKTGSLLSSYLTRKPSLTYAPIDVSRSALQRANDNIRGKWPAIQVIGLHGTYQDALPILRQPDPTLVMFLGSTIGNFDEQQAHQFWQAVTRQMKTGDFFLLGVDLVKDTARLEAAYNDAAGVTEAFTKNLFHRMNRELGSAIRVDDVEHVARYNAQLRRVEIWARFHRSQVIRVEPLEREFVVKAGEEILVEISRKFEPAALPAYFRQYGFSVTQTFTDANNWFALLLLRKDCVDDHP